MELYHVLNHAIEGRKLFLDSGDYVRFIHNMYEFNDTAPAAQSDRRHIADINVGFPKPNIRKKLVEIHGWVLMEDHYHLLISELIEGGLVQFMRKVNIGYANYYNERYERHGHVYRGKTKKILVQNEAHFLYVLHYVHLNPLDYLIGAERWRERDKSGIKNALRALKYLDTYRWSSYLDYCGTKNFPSLINKELFTDVFANYPKAIEEHLSDAELLPPTLVLE